MENRKFLHNARSMDRRRFLGMATAGGALAVTPLQKGVWSSSATAPPLDPNAHEEKPWKVDVTIYDRPGWSCTSYGLPVMRRENDELVIGFQAQREDGMVDDFYSAHAEWVFLSSKNGGRSWGPIRIDELRLDPRWPDRSPFCTNGWPVELSDGTLINVVEKVPTRQAQKERLEKVGLGHLWFPDSTFGWDLWPASYTEKLKEQGIQVFDRQGPWIPPGVVATHNRQPTVTISHDGGRSWEERPIEGLPRFIHYAGWFRRGLALPDGAALGVIYGVIRNESKVSSRRIDGAYALRSTDKGETWQISTLAQDPTGTRSYNETELLWLPSGRILAMIRGSGEAHLYQSYSEDGGRSWSSPIPTPIPGSPANLLQLKSGNILCVYRHAGYPEGYRGVLSRNEGKTWEVADEIVICDDTLPGLVGYPSSVQLDDGTIFTLYNVLRVGQIKPGDHWKYKEDLLIRPPLHSYIAGSLYTENYRKPLG